MSKVGTRNIYYEQIKSEPNAKINEALISIAISCKCLTLSKLKEYYASEHLKLKPKSQKRSNRTILNSLEQFSRDPEVKAWVAGTQIRSESFVTLSLFLMTADGGI